MLASGLHPFASEQGSLQESAGGLIPGSLRAKLGLGAQMVNRGGSGS